MFIVLEDFKKLGVQYVKGQKVGPDDFEADQMAALVSRGWVAEGKIGTTKKKSGKVTEDPSPNSDPDAG